MLEAEAIYAVGVEHERRARPINLHYQGYLQA